MTFARPTLSALIERALGDIDTRLPGADSRLRRSALDVLARTHAGATNGLYGYLDYIARSVLPETAEGTELDRRASTWGLLRKGAAPARGQVTLVGVDGALIRANVILLRDDGARYRTIAPATIVAGTALASVEAIDAGSDTDVPAGGRLTFASPVSGVQAIATSAAGISGGVDEESDTALRARLLARIRTPPRGGAASDWIAWAIEVAGVTRAWAYPNWAGPGTVGLTFVLDGRDNVLPLEADLDAVAAHIDPLRPVCAQLVVFAPTPLPVNFLIRVSPDNAAVRAAIVAELEDLIAREAEPGGTLYLSRINEAISLAAGEFDHRLLAPRIDIVAGAAQLHVRGTVQWSA